MHTLRDIHGCPDALKGAVVAIGNFDGVHRGHQAVLRAAMDRAEGSGAPAGAMTFEPHPRAFFQPDRALFRLTPEPLKLRLFARLGLDLAVVQAFDGKLASLSAEEFVRELLVEGLGVSHVVTGRDFQFGRDRGGTPDVLRALGGGHGFGVTAVEPQTGAGEVFSSTRVRDRLRAGDPRGAADILGYWWRVAGEVTGGDKRGHGLGFPTANIAVPEGFGLKHGIYAVRAHIGGARHHGAAYLGTRPSFDGGAPAIETFVFDFSGDLYGQELDLEVIAFIRGDERFDSADALVAQMRADCEKAREVLARVEEDDPMRGLPLGRADA